MKSIRHLSPCHTEGHWVTWSAHHFVTVLVKSIRRLHKNAFHPRTRVSTFPDESSGQPWDSSIMFFYLDWFTPTFQLPRHWIGRTTDKSKHWLALMFSWRGLECLNQCRPRRWRNVKLFPYTDIHDTEWELLFLGLSEKTAFYFCLIGPTACGRNRKLRVVFLAGLRVNIPLWVLGLVHFAKCSQRGGLWTIIGMWAAKRSLMGRATVIHHYFFCLRVQDRWETLGSLVGWIPGTRLSFILDYKGLLVANPRTSLNPCLGI